jgi:hypothetical protein
MYFPSLLCKFSRKEHVVWAAGGVGVRRAMAHALTLRTSIASLILTTTGVPDPGT